MQQLECRALLASVMDSGTTLQIELQQGERVEVVSNGTNYELTSTTSTFLNAGVTDAADFSAFGASTLSLNDLGQYTDIQIVDAAAGASVRFPDAGTGQFSHHFDIMLDDAASPVSIVFNGVAHFGTHNLTANTDGSILFLSGSDLSFSDGDISLTAVNATDGLAARKGISIVEGKITTTGSGDILLNGTGSSAVGLNDMDGVYLDFNAQIASTSTSANAGTITLNGTSGVGKDFAAGLQIKNSTITSSMGAIQLTGVGGGGSGHSHYGISIHTSLVESTGTGIDAATIVLDGTGGVAESWGVGLGIFNDTIVRSVDGDIAWIGRGAAGTFGNNVGIKTGEFTLESTGVGANAAKISVQGIGGSGTNSNAGASLEGDNSVIRSVDGAISLLGDVGLDSTEHGNSGIWVGASVISTGTAPIDITGIGGVGSQFSRGVGISGANTVISSQSSSITITGTGGNTTLGSGQGVEVVNSSTIVSNTGSITITGRGGNGGSFNSGVEIKSSSSIRSTGVGANAATIVIDGRGGSGENNNVGLLLSAESLLSSIDGDNTLIGTGGDGFGSSNRGVNLAGFDRIESTGTGQHAANISIIGSGGNGTAFNHAFYSVVGENAPALISSIDGDIQINATSGQVLMEGSNSAITVEAPISATGDGNITLNGTATLGTVWSRGVAVVRTVVSTNSGDLSVTGVGGRGSGNQNEGVVVSNEATLTTNTGLISLNGTSGTNNSHGVEIWGNAGVGGKVLSTGSGSIEIVAGGEGTGVKDDFRIYADAIIGGPNATGDISIKADTMTLSDNASIQSSGHLTIAPMTDGLETQSISLGFESAGGRSDLNLTDSELATIQPGFASITLGTSGLADNRNLVTVESLHLLSASTIIGGTINDALGTDFDVSSTTLAGTIDASVLRASGDVVLAANSTFLIDVAGIQPGEDARQYDQLVAAGKVDIQAGAELDVNRVISWRPQGGEQITIVQRTGGSGTFGGLAEGAVLPNFLNATISYVGGDGDDIVLTLPTTLPAFSTSVNLGDLGSAGITIHGADADGQVGQSVQSAGDVNGDGIDDFIIGATKANTADNGRTNAGEAYLIYGSRNPAVSIDVANLGNQGVIFRGAGSDQNTGHFVDAADINNDGYSDVIIGAHLRAGNGGSAAAGAVYVVWGGPTLASTIDLGNLGSSGITVLGADANDLTGNPVAAVGDLNNDGFQDFGLGAIWADSVNNTRDRAGEAYVIFGGNALQGTIDLATANTGVLRIFGAQAADEAGVSVASLGDVNGDGIDDLVVGARFADGESDQTSRAGESYIIYGSAALPAGLDLSSDADVTIYGVDVDDFSGWPARGRGDVNGDGFNDIVIGASGADSVGNQKANAGESYVIWGGSALPGEIRLSNLGAAGITISGADSQDESGRSVSIVGDLNADGFDDIAIGAYQADGQNNSASNAGEVYIILGGRSLPQTIDLNDPAAVDFVLYGSETGDEAGIMVRGAGDVNNDGVDDLIVGARYADSVNSSRSNAGEAYVVFGNSLFVPAIPLVTGPVGTVVENRPTITWDEAADAVSYELWLELIGGDSNPIVNVAVSTTELTVPTNLGIGKYRSWVRAVRGDASKSAWSAATFSVVARLDIHELPFHAEGDLRPTISWDAVDGAVGYRVYVSNSTLQTTVVDTLVSETSFTPTTDFDFGRHRIWVQPLGVGSFASTWSAVREYYVGPQLTTPAHSTLNTKPVFSWTDMSSVGSVQIYIQKGSTVVVNESGITGNTFTPTEDLAEGNYRWWVRPSATNGRAGAWSLAETFNVGGSTQILGPDETVTSGLTTITWEAVDQAAWYEVYLLHDGTGTVQRHSGLGDASYQTAPLAKGDYRVWVRPYTAAGTPARWSSVHQFTVASSASSLTASIDVATQSTFDVTPQLTWSASSVATTFNVYLTDGVSVVQQSGITDVQWTPSSDLAAGEWRWWVQPVNSSGITGPWSSAGIVDTSARAVVTANWPANSSNVTINWASVGEASKYVLQISNAATEESLLRIEDLTDTTYIADLSSASLASGSTIRIWVRAISSSGALAPWSLAASVTSIS